MSPVRFAMWWVLWVVTALPAPAQTTGVFREVFTGITGNGVLNLTNAASYPHGPTIESLTGGVAAPTNVADNYGQRLRALLTIPTGGLYRFGISSDDNSALYLSTNASPTGLTRIAWVNNWTPNQNFTWETNQQSSWISMESGQVCYLEILHKEGGGDDSLCVRWITPGGATNTPVPIQYLTPAGRPPPVLTRQPTSTSVQVGQSAAFAVAVQRPLNTGYRWYRDGAQVGGATSTNLVVGPVTLSDSGRVYHCVVTNWHGAVTSQTAVLTVTPDTTPPAITGVQYLGDGRMVLTFSELILAAGASNLAHFALLAGGGLVEARLLDDGYRVLLVATGLAYDAAFSLRVTGLTDRATSPVTMLPATQLVTQAYAPPPLELLRDFPEPPGPSSRRTAFTFSELMYHPADRPDGRDLEFIELYNSAEWPEELAGYRLSGEVDFAFPSNVVLGARQYLVIAAVPADVQAVYGLTNIVGAYTGRLSNGSGTVRLRGPVDEVLLEAEYGDDPPYPLAADGAGHSLVLARPSRGEREARAWAASARHGGSPGVAEPWVTNTWSALVLNEVLAHTDDPVEDYIELLNFGTATVDATGCWLSDDANTNRFALPGGTVLPPRGLVRFTQSQLGFSLDAAGEDVVLREPGGSHVIDAIRLGPQANGVPLGRYPDGGPDWTPLAAATPAGPNVGPRVPDLVINEIMYHPITEDGRDEFVEIHNRSGAPVNLAGWRLRDGIAFDFPTNATVAAGGYVVVAADAARLLATHPGLLAGAVYGNFAGALSDSGERLALEKPEEIVSTNGVTNLVHIVEDEVTYRDGGRWGQWSDGGGSSLERIEAGADGRQPSNWADSDETAKSGWTTIAVTGVLEHGRAGYPATQLHVLLLGAGECLVDNVEVIPQGGTNLVSNGQFSAGTNGWVIQGTHEDSDWSAGGGEGGGGALHLRAAGRGDTGVNRARTSLTSTPAELSTATLRARVRWLKGHPELLLRLRGNWLEATGGLLTTTNFGTPGAVNSRAVTNAGPVIDLVRHDPVLPAAGQAVTVWARVRDADHTLPPVLVYRYDPDVTTSRVEMARRGGGYFSAGITGQPAAAVVAFHIEATDLRAAGPVTLRFPADAPAREALVRWGDPVPAGGFGVYRLWITQATAARWTAREKNSNRPLDGTFVYNAARPVYDVGCLYAGSPFHASSFNGPTNSTQCDYVLEFPSDDRLLGATDFVLNNTSGDGTALRQRLAYWFARGLGLPYLHRRPIYNYVNGVARGGIISEDVQQPASDHVEEFFPSDERGALHKIEDWFEFADNGTTFANTDATLQRFTSAGVLRIARYRWNWRPRAVRGSANDFSALSNLVEAVNATQPEPYATVVPATLDTAQWMRTLAFERMTGNYDSYGWARGKNMYAYKPENAPWQLLTWDIDFSFGTSGSQPTNAAVDGSHDPVIATLMNQHAQARAYRAAFRELITGSMLATNVAAWLDPRYVALQANGIGVSGLAGMKTWVESRRNFLSSVLATSAAPLAVDGPAAFVTNVNYITLTGTAPVELDRVTINGIAYAPTWTALNTWRLDLPLAAGTNTLSVGGLDVHGRAVTNPAVLLVVQSTAVPEPAAGHLLLNEVMYNAPTAGTSFIELHNAATSTTYDLSRWTLPAIGLTVPDGTLVPPGAHVVFARDRIAFAAAYGASIPVAGEFTGELSNDGEWLQLIRPGPTTNDDVVIDELAYDDDPPWPGAAAGGGFSLQLVDPAQSDGRIAGWEAAAPTPGTTNGVRRALPPWPTLWANEVVVSNTLGATDNFGEHEPWLELYNGGAVDVPLAGFALTDQTNHLLRWTFPTNAVVPAGGFVTVWLDAEPGEAQSNVLHASFRIAAATGFVALVAPGIGTPFMLDYLRPGPLPANRAFGSFPDGRVCGRRVLGSPTPGAANDGAQPPLTLVVNEWLADNSAAGPDPADGDFEDWFELYNPTDFAMPLDGARLTDNAALPSQFIVPAGYTVPARGFLVVWADNETGQNSPTNPVLHVNFKLSKSGDDLLLYNAATALVDAVSFGDQITDVTEGRLPDGAGAILRLAVPTPGAPNQGPPNHPPAFVFTPAQTVFRGQTLELVVSATDTDQPPQTVTYSLVVAPAGATLVGSNGLFTWTAPEEGGAVAELVGVRAQDDGVPPLASTQQFTIAVYPIPEFEPDETNEQALTVWTVAGHHYQVEYKTNLLDATWLPYGDSFIGSGGWFEVEIEDEDEDEEEEEGGGAGVYRFYRIREWL